MNDYLWDKTGAPDPEVERLERLLGRFGSLPAMPPLPARTVRWRSMRTLAPFLATAAALVVVVAIAWRAARVNVSNDAAGAWAVSAVAGEPRIGREPVAREGQLAVGQTLVTDTVSRARIEVGTIGEVTVEPNTRVRLLATRKDHHRLALDRGTVHAFILAPPRQFVVDTPSATAVDLGCAYTLTVDDDGAGLLSVQVGWVGFEWNGRESFVPMGASCPMRPRLGPGTPRFDNAEPAIKAALDTVDLGAPGSDRASAIAVIVDRARREDAMTLWHLLARVNPDERETIYSALAARVPPPANVTHDAVMQLDRAALDSWWNVLGLDSTDIWRKWKGSFKELRLESGRK